MNVMEVETSDFAGVFLTVFWPCGGDSELYSLSGLSVVFIRLHSCGAAPHSISLLRQDASLKTNKK